MIELGWLTNRPIAHRGYHDRAVGRLENTLPAVAAAVDRGFSVECDVQLSSDGEVVVFHDDTLDRLAGTTGAVREKTLADLRQVKLIGTDERIPTLSELCDVIDGRVPLIVELKSAGGGDPDLVRRTADVLAGFTGPIATMSFDPRAVKAMRSLAPALPRGMLAYRFDSEESAWLTPLQRLTLRHLLYAPIARPDFIAYEISALPANAPLLLRHLGLPLLTWTVRTRSERQAARHYADQIIFEGFDPAIPDTEPSQPA